jgi:hypothetical protein
VRQFGSSGLVLERSAGSSLMLLTQRLQSCRFPEAMYWKRGDVVMIGKGERYALYFVEGKKSANVAIIRYLREKNFGD